MVENKNADKPAITEFERRVSNTLIPTLPQRMVANKKLESFLRRKTVMAALFLFVASISSLSLGTLKNARFNPENMADCVIQKPIPSQRNKFVFEAASIFMTYFYKDMHPEWKNRTKTTLGREKLTTQITNSSCADYQYK